MREIKFRVWNIDGYISLNKAIHDDIIVIQVPSSSNKSLIEVNWDGVELEQFTGMLDTNGVDIYEGDILEDEEHNRRGVYWSSDNSAWYCTNYFCSLSEIEDRCKVIGNIHQHTHLLEND